MRKKEIQAEDNTGVKRMGDGIWSAAAEVWNDVFREEQNALAKGEWA